MKILPVGAEFFKQTYRRTGRQTDRETWRN